MFTKNNRILTLVNVLLLLSFSVYAKQEYKFITEFKVNSIIKDYKTFFSNPIIQKFTFGISFAGIFANTPVDYKIQQHYQKLIKNQNTDNAAKIVKPLGNGKYTIPFYFGAFCYGVLFPKTKSGYFIGTWGKRTIRTILLGAPIVLLMQRGLGASRPNESDSYWKPLNDDNGVSGHSFMGAVPFLTLSKMTNNKIVKAFYYAASTFTGLSRINDNKHYFSQVCLGWWIALLASQCITSTELNYSKINPGFKNNMAGIYLSL
jgi:membrane-associated phospholipid phosphatase